MFLNPYLPIQCGRENRKCDHLSVHLSRFCFDLGNTGECCSITRCPDLLSQQDELVMVVDLQSKHVAILGGERERVKLYVYYYYWTQQKQRNKNNKVQRKLCMQ